MSRRYAAQCCAESLRCLLRPLESHPFLASVTVGQTRRDEPAVRTFLRGLISRGERSASRAAGAASRSSSLSRLSQDELGAQAGHEIRFGRPTRSQSLAA